MLTSTSFCMLQQILGNQIVRHTKYFKVLKTPCENSVDADVKKFY